MSLKGNITNIARASLHDGPGVRTVVYFKGCNLRCLWCHNPETHSAKTEILYAPTKCVHCGKCIELCPRHHTVSGNSMNFVREGCLACGACADACPAGALSSSGKSMTVDEVLKEIKKDLVYYSATGGGVTLSGGECLLQPDFAAEILSKCRAQNIGTCIESALCVSWENIERVLPYCDVFFADLKHPDSEAHLRLTGQNNRQIIENLKSLTSLAPGRVTVRIPLIPGENDSPELMPDFAAILSPFAFQLAGVELLRYNNLAMSKYSQLGKSYSDFGSPQTDEAINSLCYQLENLLCGQTKVFAVL